MWIPRVGKDNEEGILCHFGVWVAVRSSDVVQQSTWIRGLRLGGPFYLEKALAHLQAPVSQGLGGLAVRLSIVTRVNPNFPLRTQVIENLQAFKIFKLIQVLRACDSFNTPPLQHQLQLIPSEWSSYAQTTTWTWSEYQMNDKFQIMISNNRTNNGTASIHDSK